SCVWLLGVVTTCPPLDVHLQCPSRSPSGEHQPGCVTQALLLGSSTTTASSLAHAVLSASRSKSLPRDFPTPDALKPLPARRLRHQGGPLLCGDSVGHYRFLLGAGGRHRGALARRASKHRRLVHFELEL